MRCFGHSFSEAQKELIVFDMDEVPAPLPPQEPQETPEPAEPEVARKYPEHPRHPPVRYGIDEYAIEDDQALEPATLEEALVSECGS